MKIIGHRGACGYGSENTLASFKKALELGVDAIELDVYALKGGEVVVIHDDRVDRTTNGSGYVLDHSFEAIRQLDAGAGQKIPTLEEVLDLIDKRVPVHIELKSAGAAQAVAQRLEQYVKLGWSMEHFVVSSFNHVELAAFNEMMPDIRIGALIFGIPIDYAACASSLNAYSVHPSSEFITKDFVEDAKSRNLKVFVYTVDDEHETKRIVSLGVDGIFSDYPDRSRKFVASY